MGDGEKQPGSTEAPGKPEQRKKRNPPGRKWAPGESGNPKGRPKKADCLTSLLKAEVERICPKDKENRTWKQLLVLALIHQALKGNPAATKELWERVDGKVKDVVESDNIVRIVEYPATIEDPAEWARRYGGAAPTAGPGESAPAKEQK